MQRHQLGLIWGALVTAGGSVNITSWLGFFIFVLGLVVSYRSAVGVGMPSATEQVGKWRQQLASLRSKKRSKPVEASAPKQQAT